MKYIWVYYALPMDLNSHGTVLQFVDGMGVVLGLGYNLTVKIMFGNICWFSFFSSISSSTLKLTCMQKSQYHYFRWVGVESSHKITISAEKTSQKNTKTPSRKKSSRKNVKTVFQNSGLQFEQHREHGIAPHVRRLYFILPQYLST